MRLLLAVAALGAANAAKAPGSAQYAAIRPALDEIASLRAHVDGGACVPDLGAKADALCAAAEARVVADGGDAKAVRDVEKRLDALLRSIYAKQLRTARAAAVQAFRRAKLGGEYDALIKAREEFTALAEAASITETGRTRSSSVSIQSDQTGEMISGCEQCCPDSRRGWKERKTRRGSLRRRASTGQRCHTRAGAWKSTASPPTGSSSTSALSQPAVAASAARSHDCRK